MRHGDEAVQALEWVYARLSQSEGLRQAMEEAHGVPVALSDLPGYVWNDPAPADAPEPFVVFSPAESLDHRAVGPQARIFTTVPVIVKGVDQARDYDRLAPIARAIFAELDGKTSEPVSAGGTTLSSRRESGIQYPEQAEGIDYRHLGHLFTVEIN